MKLYDLPRGSHFRLTSWPTLFPPGAPQLSGDEVYWLGNIDGMYSYCKDPEGNVVHIAAYADVEHVTLAEETK